MKATRTQSVKGWALWLVLWLALMAGASVLFSAVSAHAGDRLTRHEYLPCSGSDTDRNCVWDFEHMGEGDGFSFSFFVGRDGRVYRLPHHIAHRLLHR